VFDTTSAGVGELAEVAYFDLYPDNDNLTFEGGTWSNYPYFHQKKVVAVSSMERGLFILQPRIGPDRDPRGAGRSGRLPPGSRHPTDVVGATG